jgi:hypothetical protein
MNQQTQQWATRRNGGSGRDASPRRRMVGQGVGRFARLAEPVRPELVARAKARMSAGFYDLPECLEWAVDRMIAREGSQA